MHIFIHTCIMLAFHRPELSQKNNPFSSKARCTVFNENKLTQSRPLLRSLNALNVYQINLYQHLAFMYKLNKNKAPLTFSELLKKPFHKYPTKFSENCFCLKAISLKSTTHCISFRCPKIWNKFLFKLIFRRNYNRFQSLKKLYTQYYLKVSMNLNIF